MGLGGPVAHLLVQVCRPLVEVADPGCQAAGMETEPYDVEGRLEQRGIAADQDPVDRGVRVDDVPVRVQQQRRVGQVRVEQVPQTLHHHGDGAVVQRVVLVVRGVARGEQQAVALAQRHVEVVGQVQDHVRGRVRLPGLDAAQVSGAHP